MHGTWGRSSSLTVCCLAQMTKGSWKCWRWIDAQVCGLCKKEVVGTVAWVPDDVEESTPVKKLVVPSPPTAADRGEHIASVHAVFRIWCGECCIASGRMHQHFA